MSNPSIQNRMLLTVVVGLVSLLVTHLALSFSFSQTLHYSIHKTLEKHARWIAQTASVDDAGNIQVLVDVLDPRFQKPNSGLAAVILENGRVIWRSPSAPRVIPSLPVRQKDNQGVGVFEASDRSHEWHRLSWASGLSNNERFIVVLVFEDSTESVVQVASFKEALYIALMLSFVFILAAQTIAARWSVRPLMRMSQELKNIRAGHQVEFKGEYPAELGDLTESLNDLLRHEISQTQTYRNTLSNLAHSLKTPLAVIRGAMESPDDDELRMHLRQQISKINDIVSYQLSTAARSGKSTFQTPISLEPLAVDIVEGLEKIHASKQAFCEFEIQEGVSVPANEGDMQELLGNMLDNSFKWCNQRVLLTMQRQGRSVLIQVEDDGPGFPADKISAIMERGVRADEHVQGHGIGLAIVHDIVRSYEGTFMLGTSEELGGAKFTILLPT